MKRIVTLSLVLAMCLALLTGCGGSQSEETQEPAESQGTEETGSAGGSEAEFVWVASCANTEDHPAVQGVMKFAELLEEKSGGHIHMDVFHSAQLASDRDCIEGMQINTIQSGIMVGSALAGFTDELLVFDLPFLFENSEQGQKLCDSDVGKEMLASLDDIGIKGLGFMEYGMRNITNSKLPLKSLKISRASRSAPWKTRSTWRPSASWALTPPPWPSASCSPLCSRAPSMPRKTP